MDTGTVYINAALHEKNNVKQQVRHFGEVAGICENIRAKIMVINPASKSWDEPKYKTYDELDVHVEALNELGKALGGTWYVLAYHDHDVEMRKDARELHRMMQKNNLEHVNYCLNCHWVFRGSGNSSFGLFNIINQYADRVIEIHWRPTSGELWTEFFTDGDIDYGKLAKVLKSKNVKPRLVLKQAMEDGSPNTMALSGRISLGF